MLKGVIRKMKVELSDKVNYYLDFKNDFLHMNSFLGKKIKLKHVGYECLNCQSSEIIYRQGFCKSCFFEMPSTAEWIMKPELSKAHLGIEERDLEYEKQVQLKPHVLYLAFSSSLKVGVTRKTKFLLDGLIKAQLKQFKLLSYPTDI